MILNYFVTDNDVGETIESILRNKLNISKRLVIKLKRASNIYVNDIKVFTSYIVKNNDIVHVDINFLEEDNIIPQEMELDILYEDEYILAINKPYNMVVHPSSNHLTDTLSNGIKYYLNNSKKIRPINRLDKDTSGIVLFAKNEYIQEIMNKEKTKESIKKEYIAIVIGEVSPDNGIINAPIMRALNSIIERKVDDNGKQAITKYETIKMLEIDNLLLSVLKIWIKTGRTHQIRVHMAHIGHSILGDTLYGNTSDLIHRQALHAHSIEFNHPITNEHIKIESKIPEDILNIM